MRTGEGAGRWSQHTQEDGTQAVNALAAACASMQSGRASSAADAGSMDDTVGALLARPGAAAALRQRLLPQRRKRLFRLRQPSQSRRQRQERHRRAA